MIDGGERYDVQRTKWRRARTAHACGECDRQIQPGERYRYDTGLYEGSWNCHCTCEHCSVAMKWLSVNCGGWMFGGVLLDIEEHPPEYPELAFGLLRLVVGMRRGWKRFGDPALMPVERVPAGIARIMAHA